MEFSFTPEQERLRQEVRAFLEKNVTEECRLDFKYDHPYSSHTWKLLRALGEKGWLCPSWPKEWDVCFKIHAPKQTVLQGELKDGKLVKLDAIPKLRRKDIIFMNVKDK